jgi:disulfide bond formation protein DsbB
MEATVASRSSPATISAWERLALLAATLTALGSLYLSMGMGLNACPLCFYQRSFIMAVVGVLGVGTVLRIALGTGSLSLLALPLAAAGLGVAVVHNGLVWGGVLVCPKGILGLGTAPLQSLIAHLIVIGLLLPGVLRRDVAPGVPVPRALGLFLLGALFAVLSVRSSPPMPPFNPKYDASGQRILRACEPAGPGATAPPVSR